MQKVCREKLRICWDESRLAAHSVARACIAANDVKEYIKYLLCSKGAREDQGSQLCDRFRAAPLPVRNPSVNSSSLSLQTEATSPSRVGTVIAGVCNVELKTSQRLKYYRNAVRPTRCKLQR